MLIAALAAVSVLVVTGVLGVWAFQQDAVAGEAAQLPRRPVTPILPALDTRPGTPVWTLQETSGPPGAETQDTEVLGGDSEIVLVNREVRLAEATTIDHLDIVDANTGRLRDGTAPIPVDTAQRNLGRCVVIESRAAAACALQGASVPITGMSSSTDSSSPSAVPRPRSTTATAPGPPRSPAGGFRAGICRPRSRKPRPRHRYRPS